MIKAKKWIWKILNFYYFAFLLFRNLLSRLFEVSFYAFHGMKFLQYFIVSKGHVVYKL